MEPKKQIYAIVTKGDWMPSREPVAVTDDVDAAQKTLAARGICFNTYEQTTVDIGGKEFKGDAENRSKRRYVGIDRLYTREEVFTEIERIFGRMGPHDSVRQAFMEYPENSVYITGLERPGEFIRIDDNEKVFDKNAQMIWPKVAPDVTVANDVAPIKKIKLKSGPKP